MPLSHFHSIDNRLVTPIKINKKKTHNHSRRQNRSINSIRRASSAFSTRFNEAPCMFQVPKSLSLTASRLSKEFSRMADVSCSCYDAAEPTHAQLSVS